MIFASILSYFISYAIFSNHFVNEDVYNTFGNIFLNSNNLYSYISALILLSLTFGIDYFFYKLNYY